MTEAEWLTSNDPIALLACFKEPSHRKGRLFACACCRRIWSLLTDTGQRTVETIEHWPEGRPPRVSASDSPESLMSWRKLGTSVLS